jgi:hypothetical protein
MRPARVVNQKARLARNIGVRTMSETPIFDDDDLDELPPAVAERELRDAIAPGTTGDPNDPLRDFPADRGEPKRADDFNDPPPANGPEDYGNASAPSAVEAAEELPALDFLEPAEWEGQPIPPRQWLIPHRIPLANVTMLNGDGAAGKTTIALQLAVATVRVVRLNHRQAGPGNLLNRRGRRRRNAPSIGGHRRTSQHPLSRPRRPAFALHAWRKRRARRARSIRRYSAYAAIPAPLRGGRNLSAFADCARGRSRRLCRQ